MPKSILQKEPHTFVKTILLVILVAFSATAIIFSFVVLFSDFGSSTKTNQAQSRGMFTVFAYRYIDEVHPYQAAPGRTWEVKDITFKSDHLATLETSDGINLHTLEFIFIIEISDVRILKINDVSGDEEQDANLALIRFLDFLKSENYEAAALHYGGPISRLEPYGNAAIDLALGLEGYCRAVGHNGNCLLFNIKSSERDNINGSYRFVVTYIRPDGSPHRTDKGTVEFISVVEKINGEYKVLTLPFDN